MKNIYKLFGLSLLVAGSFTSCTEEDNVIDDVFSGVTSGAVLRTIAITSNEIPINDEAATFAVELEAQDNQDGALLESVDVYVTFTDGSDDDGDSSGATAGEVFLRNIPADSFEPGPFGLPRYTLVITAPEFLAAVGLEFENTFGGDSFNTRLAMNLTDGRVFSVDNAGGIITGGFFASPFQYNTPIVCPVMEDEFVGPYTVTNNSAGVLGFNVFEEGGTVTLYIPEGGTSVERAFDYVYLPDAGVGQDPVDFAMSFVCNEVIIPAGQNSGLQCSSGLTIGPSPNGENGIYTTGDDSVVILKFTDNEGSDCGEEPKDVVATLTKQ